MPRKTELSEGDKRLREKLGASVRRLTSAKGLKPQDVALVGGVSLAHQYRIENGETTPDGLYLFKVAAHLGISMDSFFDETSALSAAPELPSSQNVVIRGNRNTVAGRDVVTAKKGK